jgi:hypothetical protein
MCQTRLALAVLSSHFILAITAAAAQTPAARNLRDDEARAPGTIRGRIVEAASGAPIPRAMVQVSGGSPSAGVSAIADDDGVFAVSGLTPGKYVIRVAKATFVQSQFPLVRPGRRPSQIELSAKQVLDVGAFALHRASVVAGRVVDRFGDPAPFVQVTLRPFPGGGRRRSPHGPMTSTNDIGEFRLAGVDPGEYMLIAKVTGEPFEERAFPVPESGVVIYPAAMTVDQAAPLRVQEGQSIDDIELRLFQAAPAKITGEIRGPDGALVDNASLDVGEVLPGEEQATSSRGTVVRNGAFELRLPPGVYDLTASGSTDMQRTSSREELKAQGRSRVTVTGDPVEGVVISLVPPRQVTGRLVFDGTGLARAPAPDTISLFAEYQTGLCEPQQATVKPDLTFSLIVGGERCLLVAGWRGAGWFLRSVTQGGTDVTFAGVSLRTPGPSDVVMTYTDRQTRVVAEVTDAKGVRADEFLVVMFPVDRAHRALHGWPGSIHVSRTMRHIGPLADGKASAEGLAPGDYLVVALAPDDVDEAADFAFYERLEGVAQRVTLIEGDTRVLSLKLTEMPAERP